jgi:anion-transporting  ArsA/GET3 family ATPase
VPSGFDKSLLIFSGKGGAGKSTVAAAAAVAAARGGKRVLLVEVGDHERIPSLFGIARRSGYAGSEVSPAIPGGAGPIWSMCITAPEALREYAVMSVKFEMVYEAIFRNKAMRFFTAAAPGLDELTIMGKLEFLHRTAIAPAVGARFDLMIFDAPPTGQALAFFKVPVTAMSMARMGPLHAKAERMWKLVSDAARTAMHIVSIPEEMSVNESIELHRASAALGLPQGKMIVNAVFPDVLPRGSVDPSPTDAEAAAADGPAGRVRQAAFAAAAWAAARCDAERQAMATLAAGAPLDRIVLPIVFPPTTGRAALETLADRLDAL